MHPFTYLSKFHSKAETVFTEIIQARISSFVMHNNKSLLWDLGIGLIAYFRHFTCRCFFFCQFKISSCYIFLWNQAKPHWLPRDNQRDREQQTLLKSISSPVWEQLAMDQFDPWQVIPRQVFTPYSRLLISTAFVVVSRVG